VIGRLAPLLAAVVTAGVAVLAGCSPSAGPQPSPSSVRTRTVTRSAPGSRPPVLIPPAASVSPLPPGRPAPAGERNGHCPYLRTGLDQTANRGVNLADLEGDRVYRTTLLLRDHPVGCRFYFYAPPYEAVAEIAARRLASTRIAYDAMVRTARSGREPIPERDFVPGVTGILYRTRFFGPDGRRDWAFAFADGRLLVVVRTQRSDTSRSALDIGRAVVRRI
jgi:hypothetical protein